MSRYIPSRKVAEGDWEILGRIRQDPSNFGGGGALSRQFWNEVSPYNAQHAAQTEIFESFAQTNLDAQRASRSLAARKVRINPKELNHYRSLVQRGDHQAAEALLKGRNLNLTGAGLNWAFAGLGGWATYKGFLEGETDEFKPSALEKAGAMALGVGQTALDLAIPIGVNLALAVPIGLAANYSIRGAIAPLKNAQARAWLKPNLAPLYSQGALAGRQAGLSGMMDSASFIGQEARHMAARRY
jgi:hypothetical protein